MSSGRLPPLLLLLQVAVTGVSTTNTTSQGVVSVKITSEFTAASSYRSGQIQQTACLDACLHTHVVMHSSIGAVHHSCRARPAASPLMSLQFCVWHGRGRRLSAVQLASALWVPLTKVTEEEATMRQAWCSCATPNVLLTRSR
jgi:hypothetical protein